MTSDTIAWPCHMRRGVSPSDHGFSFVAGRFLHSKLLTELSDSPVFCCVCLQFVDFAIFFGEIGDSFFGKSGIFFKICTIFCPIKPEPGLKKGTPIKRPKQLTMKRERAEKTWYPEKVKKRCPKGQKDASNDFGCPEEKQNPSNTIPPEQRRRNQIPTQYGLPLSLGTRGKKSFLFCVNFGRHPNEYSREV